MNLPMETYAFEGRYQEWCSIVSSESSLPLPNFDCIDFTHAEYRSSSLSANSFSNSLGILVVNGILIELKYPVLSSKRMDPSRSLPTCTVLTKPLPSGPRRHPNESRSSNACCLVIGQSWSAQARITLIASLWSNILITLPSEPLCSVAREGWMLLLGDDILFIVSFLGFLPLFSPTMKLLEDVAQVLVGDVGVDLCGADVAVAEHALDTA